jgi:hypothetical protein
VASDKLVVSSALVVADSVAQDVPLVVDVPLVAALDSAAQDAYLEAASVLEAMVAMVKDQAMVDMVEEATGTDKTSLRLAKIATAVPTTKCVQRLRIGNAATDLGLEGKVDVND